MNSILVRTLLLAFALAGVLIALSCAGGDQSGVNKPVNGANNNTTASLGLTSDPVQLDSSCYATPVSNQEATVNTAIHKIIENDPKYKHIKDQLFPANNRFRISVYADPGPRAYLHVYLEGRLKGRNAFKKMSDLFDAFWAPGCVEKVWLTVYGAPRPLAAASAPSAFLALGCEEGTYPCPNGECAPLGSCPTGLVNENTSNTNSNTGSNSNANSNTNSNTNSSSPPNSNAGNKSP